MKKYAAYIGESHDSFRVSDFCDSINEAALTAKEKGYRAFWVADQKKKVVMKTAEIGCDERAIRREPEYP